MAALADFFSRVAPWVPGAPEPAIENAVLAAATEFCAKTLTLQRTLPAAVTVAGAPTIALVQAGEVCASLLAAWVSGKAVEVLAPRQMDGEALGATSASPWGVMLDGPMVVRLLDTPSVAGLSVVVRAAMQPAPTATTVDDALLNWHGDAIGFGAVSRLAGQPGSTYENGKVGQEAQARFADAMSAERARVLRGRGRTSGRPAVIWC
jgi:hypothetical protein